VVFKSLPEQLEEYSRFEEVTQQEIEKMEMSITQLKKRLVEEKNIRKQKEEYEALAKGGSKVVVVVVVVVVAVVVVVVIVIVVVVVLVVE